MNKQTEEYLNKEYQKTRSKEIYDIKMKRLTKSKMPQDYFNISNQEFLSLFDDEYYNNTRVFALQVVNNLLKTPFITISGGEDVCLDSNPRLKMACNLAKIMVTKFDLQSIQYVLYSSLLVRITEWDTSDVVDLYKKAKMFILAECDLYTPPGHFKNLPLVMDAILDYRKNHNLPTIITFASNNAIGNAGKLLHYLGNNKITPSKITPSIIKIKVKGE